MTAALDIPPPFSVPQLAARWGCPEGLVRKLIRDGRLHCFRPGGLIRIAAAEVERFECQQHNPTPSSACAAVSPSFPAWVHSELSAPVSRRWPMSDATPSAPDACRRPPTPPDAAHLSAVSTYAREAGFARGLLWGWLNLSDDPEARERLRRVTSEFLEGGR